MIKKILNITFIVAVLCVLAIPMVFTKWESGGVSVDENRNLAKFPSLLVDGQLNGNITTEFETWFMDHLGLREDLINANATLQFRVFDRMLDQSDYQIGRSGDINYVTTAIMEDFAHVNLRTPEELAALTEDFQTVHDFITGKGIDFYYVQCYDKHSIYPEQFVNTVRQMGDISKTEQLMASLKENTTLNVVDLKPLMMDSKKDYEVYSNWGDPTHWTPRGAFIGYQYMMERLNENRDEPLRVLQESDYHIITQNFGITLNKVVHQDDMLENFVLKAPTGVKGDPADMGTWGEDQRHSVWYNDQAENDTKLLLVCDSYINSFLIEDFAESFSQVWLVYGEYIPQLPQIIEDFDPDIILCECAERVDRGWAFEELADLLNQ